jgi:hypothetical protein
MTGQNEILGADLASVPRAGSCRMTADYASLAPCWVKLADGKPVLIERLRFIAVSELPGGSNGTGQGRAASTHARHPDGVCPPLAPSGHLVSDRIHTRCNSG